MSELKTVEEENWRNKYKGMEQSWMHLKDQYAELAIALGFAGDAWFADPLADHAEIVSRARKLTQDRADIARVLQARVERLWWTEFEQDVIGQPFLSKKDVLEVINEVLTPQTPA